MKTPESILPFSKEYEDHSWEDYTTQELEMWVHLLIKRAGHRIRRDKRDKDLLDAQNYLNMLKERGSKSPVWIADRQETIDRMKMEL